MLPLDGGGVRRFPTCMYAASLHIHNPTDPSCEPFQYFPPFLHFKSPSPLLLISLLIHTLIHTHLPLLSSAANSQSNLSSTKDLSLSVQIYAQSPNFQAPRPSFSPINPIISSIHFLNLHMSLTAGFRWYAPKLFLLLLVFVSCLYDCAIPSFSSTYRKWLPPRSSLSSQSGAIHFFFLYRSRDL